MGSKFVERVVYHAYVMIQLPVCIEPVFLVFAAFHNLPLGRLLSQSHLFFLNIIPSNSLLLKYLAGMSYLPFQGVSSIILSSILYRLLSSMKLQNQSVKKRRRVAWTLSFTTVSPLCAELPGEMCPRCFNVVSTPFFMTITWRLPRRWEAIPVS